MNDLTLAIKLTATDKGLKAQLNLTKEQMKALNQSVSHSSTANRQAAASTKKHNQALKETEGTLQRITKRAHAYGATLLSMVGISKLGTVADNYRVLEQRIKTATIATGNFTAVNERLLAMSIKNGAQMEAGVSLYQAMARSAKELGATSDDILKLTNEVQQLGVIGGTAQANISAGVMQFSQAMSAGVVRAEEMNSLLENMPELANRIAKGLNLSVGEMRQLMLDGDLLSKDVFAALIKQSHDVDIQFQGMRKSLGQTKTAFGTAFAKGIADLDVAAGITDAWAEKLQFAADNMDGLVASIIPIVQAVEPVLSLGIAIASLAGGAFVINKLTRSVGGLTGKVKLAELGMSAASLLLVSVWAPGMTAATIATTLYTKALTGLKVVMSFLGGPVGVAVALIGTLSVKLYDYTQNTGLAAAKVRSLAYAEQQLAIAEEKRIALQVKIKNNYDERGRLTAVALQNNIKEFEMEQHLIEARIRRIETEATLLKAGMAAQEQAGLLTDQLQAHFQSALSELEAPLPGLESHMKGLQLSISGVNALLNETPTETYDTMRKGYESALQYITPLNAKLNEYKEHQKAINTYAQFNNVTDKERIKLLAKLELAYKKNIQTSKKLTKAKKDLIKLDPCKAIKQEMSCMDRLVDKYVPLAHSVNEHNQQMNELNLVYSAGSISADHYAAAVKKIDDSFKGLPTNIKTTTETVTKVSQSADPFFTAWENGFKRLDDAGAEFWQNLFSGAENSLDGVQDMLQNWLAEMAHTLLTKPLMMNIQGMFLGTAGGGGQSGIMSQLSGGQGGGFSGLSNNMTSSLNTFGASYFGAPAGSASEFAAFNSVPFDQIGNQGITGSVTGSTGGLGGFAQSGMGGLLAGYGGAAMTGNALSGAAMGVGQIGLMGGVSGLASGAGFMSGAGAALGAMGPVGWAALAIGALAGSGMFSGKGDITPDLNVRTEKTNNLSDLQGTNYFDNGAEENGTFDPHANYIGRFNAFSFSTKHDAFSSADDAQQFVDSVSQRYAILEETIYKTFGEADSQLIHDAMSAFKSGRVKNEDFAGTGDFDAIFKGMFNRIFEGVGAVADEEIARFEQVYLDALGASGNIEVGIGFVASSKQLVDANSSRELDSIIEILGLFTHASSDLNDQLAELSATTQLLALESIEDYKGFVAEVIELGSAQQITAVRGAELANILSVTNALMSNVTQSTYQYSIAGAKLAETLAIGAGGLDALAEKTNFYYQNFFSAEERTADLLQNNLLIINDFNAAHDELGAVTAGSNDSLRAFISSLNLTTDAGISAYNAAINLAPVFAQTTDAMMTMANSLGSIYSSAEKWQLDTFSDEQKSNYYSQRADEDYLALQGATGSAEIQALTSSIVGWGDKMWALLDDKGKKDNLDDYLQAAHDVEAAAQDRMGLSDNELELIDFKPIEIAMKDSAEYAASIKLAADAIEKAAAVMEQAAQTSLQAANTEKQVTVSVDLPDTEVGF